MTNLQRIRNSRSLSQSQLAKTSGVSVRMIQYWEQRAKNINMAAASTVLKLADALDCEVRDLLEQD